MRTLLLNETLNLLRSYPQFDFPDCYYILFEQCWAEGENELTKKVFYEIILDAMRSKDPWVIEELISPNSDMIAPLKELNLYDFSLNFLKVAPRKKRYKHKLSRVKPLDENEVSFCACCHTFPITVDEIQNFPCNYSLPCTFRSLSLGPPCGLGEPSLSCSSEKVSKFAAGIEQLQHGVQSAYFQIKNCKDYIASTFKRAYEEKDLKKRNFLIERLLQELYDKNGPSPQFYKLWEEAIGHEISVDIMFINLGPDDIFDKNRFKIFMKAFSKRDKRNDHIIDDMVQLLLEHQKWDLAYYVLCKVSSPYMRIFYASWNITTNKKNTEKELMFLRRVYAGVRHEL